MTLTASIHRAAPLTAIASLVACGATDAPLGPAFAKGGGTVAFSGTELPAPPSSSNARGINASGQIAGVRLGGCVTWTPVMWTADHVLTDLPIPSGFCSGLAREIAADGTVYGYVHTVDNVRMNVRWLPGPAGYTAAAIPALPTGNVPWMDDMAANGHAPAYDDGPFKAYLWTPEEGFVPLVQPVGNTCYASGINETDELVGACKSGGPSTAVYWADRATAPVILPTSTAYTTTSARGINNFGVIVGYGFRRTKSGTSTVGLRWTRNGTGWTLEELGAFAGGETSPTDVNDQGWVAGSSTVSPGKYHAFVLKPGAAMQDLGSVGPESFTFGINSPAAGTPTTVVGVTDIGSVKRAVVWQP